jgi:hypothetical protein
MKNWLLYNSKRLNDVLTVVLLLIIIAVGVYVYVDRRSNVNNSPTTTTVAPTTTTVTPMSKENVAYLTVIELIPAFVRADATESQIWEMLGTICTGFEGGLSYIDIGTILVESADTAGIYPFGYSEAGVLVGTATNLRCPQYDGWQNS